MSIGIRIGIGIGIGGEVAVEVRIDMIGTGTTRVRESTVTVAGAAVQVQTITKTVGGLDMMMSGAVEASPMGGIMRYWFYFICLNKFVYVLSDCQSSFLAKVPPLLVVVVVLNLVGAHLLGGHLQGVKTLKYVTLTNVLQLPKMLHHVVDQLILEALHLADLMQM